VFLKLGNRTGLTVLRSLGLLMVVWGAYESVATVFNAADAAMGLMATINLMIFPALCEVSMLGRTPRDAHG
jgi:AGCS family alanine or glycine:cation symporter